MTRFDSSTWLARALCRFQKARSITGGSRYVRDVRAIEHLTRLQEWCQARRIELQFTRGGDGTFDGRRRSINICAYLSPVRQVHVLLHECGHFLIGDRRLVHRVDVLDDEIDAWRRGAALARRLRLDIDIEEYNRTRAKYVSSYLRWALRRKRGKIPG